MVGTIGNRLLGIARPRLQNSKKRHNNWWTLDRIQRDCRPVGLFTDDEETLPSTLIAVITIV